MNRVIKFRIPFFNKDGSLAFFGYWGTIDHIGKPSLDHGCFTSPSSNGLTKGWHQQFSGLLDKNGKEIYDGDILASAWDTMLRLWLIEFSDGSFTNVNIGVDGYLGERFKLTQDKCSERVVVGNRFERADLLK